MFSRILLALSLLACCAGASAGTPNPAPESEWNRATTQEAERLATHLAALPKAAPGALTVRLAFFPLADLDLYVSDPLQETVYYGNRAARSGGRLARDRHCKESGGEIRVEEIIFASPPPGRYRIGLDYPHRCVSNADVVPYVLTIHEKGGQREIRGLAQPVVFMPFVAEIEIRP